MATLTAEGTVVNLSLYNDGKNRYNRIRVNWGINDLQQSDTDFTVLVSKASIDFLKDLRLGSQIFSTISVRE